MAGAAPIASGDAVPPANSGLFDLLARAATVSWAHPYLGAVAVGLVGWFHTTGAPVLPGDYVTFVGAGTSLLHGHLAQVFASPTVQSGPLTLGTLAGAAALFGWASAPAVWVSTLLSITASVALTRAIRVCSTGIDAVRAGAGLLGAWVGAILLGGLDGGWAHPTHAVVPLLWLLATRRAQRGEGVRAGLLLGLSMAFDTWAVMGLCALAVLAPRPQQLARAAVAAAVVALAAWLPFFLAGPIRSGELVWPCDDGSIPCLLDLPLVSDYRLAQALVASAVGAALAYRLRRDADLAWLLPVVVVSVRVVTDGVYYTYYGLPVLLGLLTGAAVMVGRADPRAPVLVAAVVATAVRPPLGVIGAALPMAVAVAVCVVVVSRPAAQLGTATAVDSVARRRRQIGRSASARSASRYDPVPKPAIVPVATADTTDV